MNNEIEEENESSTRESLEAIGRVIAGELEFVGGILTGDPISQAEGEFNVEAGSLQLENADALEDAKEAAKDETDETNQI